mmetsp:Transcript_25623/g.36123  ORF Transcript_25623/g.36123 Transcript_25623/m.36123 type:complete len:104 (+) Transcript_25623:170-481(+)
MSDLLDTVFLYMLNAALSQDRDDTKQEDLQETDGMSTHELVGANLPQNYGTMGDDRRKKQIMKPDGLYGQRNRFPNTCRSKPFHEQLFEPAESKELGSSRSKC